MLESVHNFSGIVALLGDVPNSDSDLAVIHETKHAQGVCTLMILVNTFMHSKPINLVL